MTLPRLRAIADKLSGTSRVIDIREALRDLLAILIEEREQQPQDMTVPESVERQLRRLRAERDHYREMGLGARQMGDAYVMADAVPTPPAALTPCARCGRAAADHVSEKRREIGGYICSHYVSPPARGHCCGAENGDDIYDFCTKDDGHLGPHRWSKPTPPAAVASAELCGDLSKRMGMACARPKGHAGWHGLGGIQWTCSTQTSVETKTITLTDLTTLELRKLADECLLELHKRGELADKPPPPASPDGEARAGEGGADLNDLIRVVPPIWVGGKFDIAFGPNLALQADWTKALAENAAESIRLMISSLLAAERERGRAEAYEKAVRECDTEFRWCEQHLSATNGKGLHHKGGAQVARLCAARIRALAWAITKKEGE